MGSEQLKRWLDSKWMGHFAYIFLQNGYTEPEDLLTCTKSDIRSLLRQIDKPGHRLKARVLIEEVLDQGDISKDDDIPPPPPVGMDFDDGKQHRTKKRASNIEEQAFNPVPQRDEREDRYYGGNRYNTRDSEDASPRAANGHRYRGSRDASNPRDRNLGRKKFQNPSRPQDENIPHDAAAHVEPTPVLDHKKANYRKRASGALAAEFRRRSTDKGVRNLRPADIHGDTYDERDSYIEEPISAPPDPPSDDGDAATHNMDDSWGPPSEDPPSLPRSFLDQDPPSDLPPEPPQSYSEEMEAPDSLPPSPPKNGHFSPPMMPKRRRNSRPMVFRESQDYEHQHLDHGGGNHAAPAKKNIGRKAIPDRPEPKTRNQAPQEILLDGGRKGSFNPEQMSVRSRVDLWRGREESASSGSGRVWHSIDYSFDDFANIFYVL